MRTEFIKSLALKICLFILLLLSIKFVDWPSSLLKPPEYLLIPFAEGINYIFDFMQNELGLVYFTRGFAGAVSWVLDIFANLLYGARGGFNFSPLPWTVLAATGFMIGYALKGWKLGALSGGVFVWFAVFGQWKWAMQTLSVIMVAAPLSVLMGFILGVQAWKRPWFESVLSPILSITQSLPHFCYLIPVVVFFGVGDHAGVIATVIFATPPMIRMTTLGLKKVPSEVIESGQMCGATTWQILRYVRAPTAREDILIGVNQVIMQCLAMVVIASFIGAPGLGYKLLQLLQSLKIGRSLELGISIVLLAIALDSCCKAWVARKPVHWSHSSTWYHRYSVFLVWVGVVVCLFLLAQIYDYAQVIPRRSGFSTAPFWDRIVDWITIELFDTTLAIRSFLSLYILRPLRDTFLAIPWVVVVAIAALMGWKVGRLRSAIICCSFVFFIAFSGWWDRAMITTYMVSFSVFCAVLIGFPLGIVAAKNEHRARRVLLCCDTAQTFPSFVYLIPVIMLFQINDVSAVGAVIIYAIVPILRYTIEGLRSVPQSLIEAADMCGATAWQKLINVRLPMAIPTIMVGLNQTVVFSLFMVIIAAFIGTQDLGQELMRALSASDVGKGLTLGLCVAFIGLFFDHISSRWAKEKREALGLN